MIPCRPQIRGCRHVACPGRRDWRRHTQRQQPILNPPVITYSKRETGLIVAATDDADISKALKQPMSFEGSTLPTAKDVIQLPEHYLIIGWNRRCIAAHAANLMGCLRMAQRSTWYSIHSLAMVRAKI